MAGDRDHRAPRDDREADEGRNDRERRSEDEEDLVHAARHDVLHQRQLDAVHQGLEQSELARPVGAWPLLHPADDASLGPDRHQGRDEQEEKDDKHLEHDDPPRVVAEARQRGDVVSGRAGRASKPGHSALLTGTSLLIETTAPWPARSVDLTLQPAELVGNQTTRSGMSAISTGTVIAPWLVATVTLPPSAVPTSAAVAADMRATAARAVPARFGSPSCIRPTSRRLCQVASCAPTWPARPRPGSSGLGPLTWLPGASVAGLAAGVGLGDSAADWVRIVISRRTAMASGKPKCTSISSASAASTCRSVLTDGTARAAVNEPGRPSQFTNVPAFSATAATGKTTSARSVTALTRSSRLTTNGAISIACSAATGSGRSAGSTPATTRAPSSPVRAASSIAEVSRPGVPGSELLPQALATSARAAGSVTGRPMGSSAGMAPASTAPRSPARRGTQASRAPDATASVATAASAPGTSASRSPARMIAPGALSASPARRHICAASPGPPPGELPAA